MRTTINDVRSALKAYVTVCKVLNMVPDGYHVALEEGDQANGRAWRLCLHGDRVTVDGKITYPKGSGRNRPPAGDDYLGWTMKEAQAALQNRTGALWDVVNFQNREKVA